MTHLSLEEVMNLLDVDTINGTPRQMERLRIWIESLVEKRGNAFVLENRRTLQQANPSRPMEAAHET
jgi:hypothetical protein